MTILLLHKVLYAFCTQKPALEIPLGCVCTRSQWRKSPRNPCFFPERSIHRNLCLLCLLFVYLLVVVVVWCVKGVTGATDVFLRLLHASGVDQDDDDPAVTAVHLCLSPFQTFRVQVKDTNIKRPWRALQTMKASQRAAT